MTRSEITELLTLMSDDAVEALQSLNKQIVDFNKRINCYNIVVRAANAYKNFVAEHMIEGENREAWQQAELFEISHLTTFRDKKLIEDTLTAFTNLPSVDKLEDIYVNLVQS